MFISLILLAGAVAIVSGCLLIFNPALLKKADDIGNKIVISIDELVFKHRVSIGIIISIFGLVLVGIGIQHVG